MKFWNLPELTGSAFKNDGFVDYVARIAAWRDKVTADASERVDLTLERMEREYEAARHRVCMNYRADVERAFQEFERRQEATQRNVERMLRDGKEVPTGRKLAQFHGPHVNDHYNKIRKQD